MGAKQSQDSTVSERPSAMPSGVVGRGGGGGSRDEDPEGDGILVPPIFPSLLSTSSASGTSHHRENGHHQRRSPRLSLFGRQGDERSERSGEVMTSHSFSEGGMHEERGREHHRRHHHHHHHHHHGNGSGGSHEDRSHQHHHRRHHHHHHREHGERHSRRARRYLHDDSEGGAASGSAANSREAMDLDLNFSLIALNQRLRALQLRRQSEENGEEGGGGEEDTFGSRRHRSRTHDTHSHPRHQFGSAPFFFVRPSSRRSRCPVCGKDVPPGDMETHIVMCMTKPAVEYNEDRLLKDAGECSICLEDMETGDKIARLPCLCVYHLKCLKLWYEKNKTCPEHPEYYGTGT